LRSAERSEGNPLNEACFSIWKKKKPKDFAKQRTGGVVTDLWWVAVRRAKRRQSAERSLLQYLEKEKAQGLCEAKDRGCCYGPLVGCGPPKRDEQSAANKTATNDCLAH